MLTIKIYNNFQRLGRVVISRPLKNYLLPKSFFFYIVFEAITFSSWIKELELILTGKFCALIDSGLEMQILIRN